MLKMTSMMGTIDPKNMSILVVDDRKSMRLTLRKMLKSLKMGKQLLFAENGKQGMDILFKQQCDLAILDWNMPVMNGIEMLQKIRNDDALRDLPVIMVTAEAERDIVAEVAETEISGYLLKPLTLKALDEKLHEAIARFNNPDPATLHRKKARALEEKGKYKEAIKELEKALEYKPGASRILRQMGLLHFRVKKNKMAVKYLLKAVSSNRQDTISRVYLADYFLKTNDLKNAGKYYLQVLTLSDRYDDKAFDIGKKMLKNDLRNIALAIFSKVVVHSKNKNATREKIIDIFMSLGEYDYPSELP